MVSTKAIAHYQRFERFKMSENDKEKYQYILYSPTDFKKCKKIIKNYDEDEQLPEERSLECILAYGLDPSIIYSEFIKHNDTISVFKKFNDFMNLYYIRFIYYPSNTCYCSPYDYTCSCNIDYNYYVYNFNLSVRENETEAIFIYVIAIQQYYLQKCKEIYTMGSFFEKNKKNIQKTGRQLYKKIEKKIIDNNLLENICSFVR